MNNELSGIEKAIHPDGFVDFYLLLGVNSATPGDELQKTINTLYQDAQTNRDHRIQARRREYQTLLELLPHARTILLNEARRKRYNAYRNAVEMQLPRLPYTDFFEGLIREKDAIDTKTDIFTLRDLSRLRATSAGTEVASPAPLTSESTKTEAEKREPARLEAAPAVSVPSASAATVAMPPMPAPETTATDPMPVAQSAARFPLQSAIGGLCVLGGMLAALPPLAGVPIVIAAPLALICAGVIAYVFSLATETTEAVPVQ